MSPAAAPGPVSWPDKMISRHEAADLVADWPVAADSACDELWPKDLVLLCRQVVPVRGTRGGRRICGQSMGQLQHAGTTYNGSADEMMAMILRHMVMAHDVPLNIRASPAPAAEGSDSDV